MYDFVMSFEGSMQRHLVILWKYDPKAQEDIKALFQVFKKRKRAKT